ncbi:MAG: GntR family transcriptional regulator [Mycobacterium sp.]
MGGTPSTERTYGEIRDRILSGRLLPGARLVEVELAAELDVSRTPIREALRQLSAEGLIEMLPNRGATVRSWTDDELHDIYQSRAELDSLAAALATDRMDVATLERLEDLCLEMEACGVEPDRDGRDRLTELNTEFHDTVRDAARSPTLASMIHGVAQLPLVRATFHRYAREDLERSGNHHREMIAAFRAGDRDWAAAITRAHVLAARASLMNLRSR